jgi:hypothetical protein
MEKIYRELEDGKIVKGIGLPAFIHNMQYHLVTIKVYEDGLIDCWENVDFEGFVEKVRSGWIVTKVPKGERISRFHSFVGNSDGIETYIEELEFVKEVRDVLDQLQGQKTSSDRCKEAFRKYLDKQNDVNLQNLKNEYSSIPEHLKRYVLGDMDSKDGPIRYVLDGKPLDQERLERWQGRYGKSN